jgi:hypothetical protein
MAQGTGSERRPAVAHLAQRIRQPSLCEARDLGGEPGAPTRGHRDYESALPGQTAAHAAWSWGPSQSLRGASAQTKTPSAEQLGGSVAWGASEYRTGVAVPTPVSKPSKKFPKAKNGLAPQKPLNRNEWSFGAVPDAELTACYFHEYSREMARREPWIRELAQTYEASRMAPKGDPAHKSGFKALSELDKFMRLRFPGFLVVTEGFPETPWQELDQRLQLRMVCHLNEDLGGERAQLLLRTLSIELLKESEWDEPGTVTFFRAIHECLGQEDFSQTDYGVLAINWNRTDTAIKRAFDEWLTEERAARKKRGLGEIKSQARTARLGDRLKCLGALRVMRHYPKNELVDYPQTKLKPTIMYGHYTDLCEAAAKARKLLEALENR